MSDWTTLDDYLEKLFRTGKTKSDEFQTLLKIYGRERIETAWRRFKNGKTDTDHTRSKTQAARIGNSNPPEAKTDSR
jgi:hypothetical protein